jgi:tRNA modification GTPase
MDTIFALASASGRAGVAVIRVSGPQAFAAAEVLGATVLTPGLMRLRPLRRDSELLDQALVVGFRAPASFTGEDVVEFHVHGSRATVAAVLSALEQQEGLRLSEPGEFTRRGFENGKIDLSQVEGLADLIDAETEAQRKQAVRLLSGEIGRLVEGWRAALVRAAALTEATIDFADDDVPVDVKPEVISLLSDVRRDLKRQSDGFGAAERLRDGFEVAIVGAPNVGKSTLLNALAGREAAITSDIAGTTRDVIEVRMDLGGLAVTFLDMAGLRETEDHVEGIGVSRALSRASAADIRLVLTLDEKIPDGLTVGADDLVLRAKGDLTHEAGRSVSGLTGKGVGQVVDHVRTVLEQRTATASTISHQRHIAAVRSALASLDDAVTGIQSGLPDEVVVFHVRRAARGLEHLVGRVDVEDYLDVVFSSFCIGK